MGGELLEFPCAFPIKVMGVANADFETSVLDVMREHVSDLGEDAVQSRPSRGGRYVSLTITFTARSRTQLDDLYRALSAHPAVKVVL